MQTHVDSILDWHAWQTTGSPAGVLGCLLGETTAVSQMFSWPQTSGRWASNHLVLWWMISLGLLWHVWKKGRCHTTPVCVRGKWWGMIRGYRRLTGVRVRAGDRFEHVPKTCSRTNSACQPVAGSSSCWGKGLLQRLKLDNWTANECVSLTNISSFLIWLRHKDNPIGTWYSLPWMNYGLIRVKLDSTCVQLHNLHAGVGLQNKNWIKKRAGGRRK